MVLHCCCGSCALPIIDYLLNKKKEKEIILYFSNSNIYPEKEYFKRLKGLKEIALIYNLLLFEDEYNHKNWLHYIKRHLSNSLNSYPENDIRCLYCFKYRLERTKDFCIKNNLLEFGTTLSVNRFKNTNFINDYGLKLARENNLKYIPFDLDPLKAYQKGIELSKKYNLYRQKYCGCEFSL